MVKHGYRKWPVTATPDSHGTVYQYNYLAPENIVNRPNSIRMTREIQKLLAYNIKIKYFTRYEKRLAE